MMADDREHVRVAHADPRIVVLLIDDQAFVAAAIGHMLSTEHDIEFHYCQHPREALSVATRVQPSIILQDLVMPEIDGLAMLNLLRSNPRTAAVPIVVLSGNDDPDARMNALNSGAADYLVKLPTRDDLLGCLRRHTGAARGREVPRTRRAEESAAGAPPRSDETLDRSIIATFRHADPQHGDAFVSRLIEQFLRDAALQISELHAAAARGDLDRVRANAHSLKGAASTIGGQRLASLCTQLERHAARHSNVAVLSTLTSEIGQEFTGLHEALTAETRPANGT